ncbi:MAG: hypothetical protein ACKOE6_05300 [Flammeovirgaceae bacterium]
MQTGFLKILLVLLLPSLAGAQSINQPLKRADSLFRGKQYTQAFVVYQSVQASKKYTPAMLLKMAYTQEGLGHAGSCLYYLNLYHLATGDDQALGKMEELAQKNQLEGYQTTQHDAAQHWWKRNLLEVAMVCVAFAGLLLAWAYVQRKKNATYTPLVVVALGLVIFSLGAINFWGNSALAIVSSPRTYVLDAPSAGGNVLEVLAEGHRVEMAGTKDVWAKVTWRDKPAYIKRTQLWEVKL